MLDMDPSEVEFLAEKEVVKIIPNFSLDKIYLIGVSTFHCYGQLNMEPDPPRIRLITRRPFYMQQLMDSV